MDAGNQLKKFEAWLIQEEKAAATVEKYCRDAAAFVNYCCGRKLTKELTLAYKELLISRYAPGSVNAALASVHAFLKYIHREDCRVKPLRLQKVLFIKEEKELTKEEYARLLLAAGDSRIAAVMRTIGATGIRVSELRFITVQAVASGRAIVRCKGKARFILLPVSLCRYLQKYMKKAGIKTGSIFVTKSGNPLDRSNIWKEMKALCEKARVDPGKVYPHNLRHLFARTFYKVEKDLLRLADILGHASINTTRIYTADSGKQHRRILNRIGAMFCTT